MGDRSRTGPELLAAVQALAKRWLAPWHFQLGKVMFDNGTNLLAALYLEKKSHMYLACHVSLTWLYIVIKHFGFQEVSSFVSSDW